MLCRRVGLALAMVAVIGGCAPLSLPPPALPSDTTGDAAAEAMFKVGYQAMTERYIEPVSVEDVALAGLRGFADIDPTLSVGKVGDIVALGAESRTIASLDTPRAHDADGWVRASLRLWAAARRASPAVAAADDEAVFQAVFGRAAGSLDATSRYASAAQSRTNRQRRDGAHGIGARVGDDGARVIVVEIAGGGPAEAAGLRVGDELIRIDGEAVAGLGAEAVARRLDGDPTGTVRLAVYRPGRGPLRFVVQRRYLTPDTVAERWEDGVLYLGVTHFNRGTADAIAETLGAVSSDLGDAFLGVILDLRGNPGGLLQQAVQVADLFLAHGNILSTRGRHPDSRRDYEAGAGDLLAGRPLVVMIDGESASSAELVAAALRDQGRAVVVGSTSFGKGTVQTVVPLPNGGELGLTWSRAVPPAGAVLHGHGVRPTLCTSGVYVADPDLVDRLLAGSGAEDRPSAGCPSERRDDAVDPLVARRVLLDSALYARALHRPDALMAGGPATGH